MRASEIFQRQVLREIDDEECDGSPPPKVDFLHPEISVFGKVMETCDASS